MQLFYSAENMFGILLLVLFIIFYIYHEYINTNTNVNINIDDVNANANTTANTTANTFENFKNSNGNSINDDATETATTNINHVASIDKYTYVNRADMDTAGVLPIVKRNTMEFPILRTNIYQPHTYLDYVNQYMQHKIIPLETYKTLSCIDTINKLLDDDLDFAFVDEEILTRYIKQDCKYLNALIKVTATSWQHRPLNFAALGIGFYTDFYFIVPFSSPIIQPSDMVTSGKTCVMGILGASFYYFTKLAPLYGIDLVSDEHGNMGIGLVDKTDHLTIVLYDDILELFNDFRSKKVDTVFLVENPKCAPLRDLAKNMKIRLIHLQQHITPPTYATATSTADTMEYNKYGLNKTDFNKMVRKAFQWIWPRVIDLNKFKVPTANTYTYLETYSTRNILVVRNAIKPNIVKHLLTCYINDLDRMRLSIDKEQYIFGLSNSDMSSSHDFNYMELVSFDKVIPLHHVARDIYSQPGGLIRTTIMTQDSGNTA